MGISASSLNIIGGQISRGIQYPLTNTAEVSRGAVLSSSLSAQSTTSFGLTANALAGANYSLGIKPATDNSTATAAASTSTSATTTAQTQTSDIETGDQLQQVLNTISAQAATTGVEGMGQNTQNVGISQNVTAVNPVNTTLSNISMPVSGQYSILNGETSPQYAAVNANFNVQLSSQATDALKALQSQASINMIIASANNLTSRMDGQIPLTAATTINEFSNETREVSKNTNGNLFDLVTEGFKTIAQGGGQGGQSGQPYRQKKASKNAGGFKAVA